MNSGFNLSGSPELNFEHTKGRENIIPCYQHVQLSSLLLQKPMTKLLHAGVTLFFTAAASKDYDKINNWKKKSRATYTINMSDWVAEPGKSEW